MPTRKQTKPKSTAVPKGRKTTRPGKSSDRGTTATASTTRSNRPPTQRLIYLLSDSTGNLGKHMTAALLTQFPPGSFDVIPIGFLQEDTDLARAFSIVATSPGIILHSVVSPEQKRKIIAQAGRLSVPHQDLTGGIVDFLASTSGISPTPNRGRLHEVNAAYQKRISAIDFVLTHDDGLGMDTLIEADIILAGVSRTSKTPTSIYLAQQGFKVANVALAIESGVPSQLLAAPRNKTVGLLIDPRRLSEIRMNRQTGWRMGLTSYSEEQHVRREVEWSRQLFNRQGWPSVNVTNQAIEETAARIVEVLGLSHQPLSS